MADVVLASHNAGKLAEFSRLLMPLGWQLLSIADFTNIVPAETATTFVENALIKARAASALTKLPALADDSGLVVPALDGAPGIYSARYAGEHASHTDHIKKLLEALADRSSSDRAAYFICVLVWMRSADDPAPIIATGYWQGSILSAPCGEHGFGYDPIFYVPTHQCAAAELTVSEKNKISHRGQAWQQLCEQLQKIK